MLRQLLDQRYQPRAARLAARITQRPVDSTGKGLGYVIAEVGGQTGVRVANPANVPYYPGDYVLVEQRGSAASASYVIVDFESGPRPDSGQIEFTSDTTIGNESYGAGDLLWGNPFQAHFHMDYSEGHINLKSGSTYTGRIDAGTGTFIAGNPSGTRGVFSASGIIFRDATTEYAGLTSGQFWVGPSSASQRLVYDQATGTLSITGTINAIGGSINLYGSTGGRLSIGEIQNIVSGQLQGTGIYAFRLYDANGVPQISFTTGDTSGPTMRIGAANAKQYLQWQAGQLQVKGNIYATGGEFANFDIYADSIISKNGKITIQANATSTLNEGIYLQCNRFDGDFGVIHWLSMEGNGQPVGIITTWRSSLGTNEVWIQGSGTPDGIGGTVTLVASQQGRLRKVTLSPYTFDVSNVQLKIGAINNLTIRVYYGAESVIPYTWDGLVARAVPIFSNPLGPGAQLVAVDKAVLIGLTQLSVFAQADIRIQNIELRWCKANANAYLSSVKLVAIYDDGMITLFETSNVRYDAGAGTYMETWQINDVDIVRRAVYLQVTPAAKPGYTYDNDIIIYYVGAEINYIPYWEP